MGDVKKPRTLAGLGSQGGLLWAAAVYVPGNNQETKMNRISTLAAQSAVALMLTTAAALAGNPAGTYQLTGANPDGEGEYVGTVTVKSTGETFAVAWDIAGTAMEGTGVAYYGQETTLSVAFGGDQTYGIAQFTEQSDGTWFGSWVMAGGEVQGIETWTRQ